MRAPAVGTKRLLDPAGMDAWDSRVSSHAEHTVVLTQPHGCPKNGTMGHAYVDCKTCEAEAGHRVFVGLVLLNSLVKVGK